MKTIAIIANVIFILAGLVSMLLAMTSPMLFDAPGSENNRILYVTFASALILPIACFGAVIASLTYLYKKNDPKKALRIFLIPGFFMATLIGSLIAIDVFCAGLFSCPPS